MPTYCTNRLKLFSLTSSDWTQTKQSFYESLVGTLVMFNVRSMYFDHKRLIAKTIKRSSSTNLHCVYILLKTLVK